MTIRYTCQSCDSTLNIKDEKAGQKGKCPKCGESFTVPQPEKSAKSEKKSSGKKKKTDKAAQEAEEKKKKAERDAFFDEFIAQDAVKPSYEEDDELGGVKPKTGKELSKSGGSAAGTAGDLLSMTGKKGREDDEEWDGEQPVPGQEPTITVADVAEGVGRQFALPIAGVVGAVVLIFFLSQVIFAPSRDLPDLATVSGKVTLDGNPLPYATVRFVLKDAWGPNAKVKVSAAYGRTDLQGEFTINYAIDVEGAVVGMNRVEITARTREGLEYIKKWYNHESKLEFDVKSGSNSDANFDLSSADQSEATPQ